MGDFGYEREWAGDCRHIRLTRKLYAQVRPVRAALSLVAIENLSATIGKPVHMSRSDRSARSGPGRKAIFLFLLLRVLQVLDSQRQKQRRNTGILHFVQDDDRFVWMYLRRGVLVFVEEDAACVEFVQELIYLGGDL
jgi:hypothetical protein